MNKLQTVLAAALFVSLAGNLFMGGLMLGQRASTVAVKPAANDESDDRRAEWRKRDQMLREKLSESDRAIFEEVKAKYHDDIEAKRNALDAARDNLEAAQSAEIADNATIAAAGRDEAIKKAEFMKAIRAARAEISSRLSPEGRAEMEKQRPPKGKPGHGRSRRRDDDGDDQSPASNEAAPAPAPADTPKPADCGTCEVPGQDAPAKTEMPPQP